MNQAPIPLPKQPDGLAPFVIMMRADGKFIVYDERRALGKRTRWTGDYLESAVAACRGELAGELLGHTEVLVVGAGANDVHPLKAAR